MKSVRFFIGLFVLAWLELFCSDPVSIEWQGDREVVVSCILTRDTVQTVNLSYSSSMQDGKVEFVDSAEVVISGIYVYNGYKSGPGEWTVPCQPLPGKEYQLEVRLPDGRVLLAETRFPVILALNSVELYQPESWLYEEEENWLLPVEDENERLQFLLNEQREQYHILTMKYNVTEKENEMLKQRIKELNADGNIISC